MKNGWLYAALIVFLILSQWSIFVVQEDLWFDPAFSLETIDKMKTDGFSSIDFGKYDVHPPVYYYMLYGWDAMNPGMDQDLWGRELSVLLGILFFIVVYFGLREVFGRSGEIATFFMVMLSTYIHYGTELRMYMLVLLLSAIIFYCVVKGLEGWWFVIAGLCLFTLPNIQYFAGMAMIFYPMLFFFYWMHRDPDDKKVWLRKSISLFVTGLTGCIVAILFFAYPQSTQIVGTWLPANDIGDFTSAVFHSMFYLASDNMMIEANLGMGWSIFLTTMYVVTQIFLGALALVGGWLLFKKKKMPSRTALMVAMGSAVIFPLGALAVMSVKSLPLYHPRFFLVIMWMFAAMTFVLIADVLRNVPAKFGRLISYSRSIKLFVLVSVLFIISTMLWLYLIAANHDLARTEAELPCSGEIVVHESPFTLIPFMSYSRIHGCNWRSMISTDVTEEMGHTGGFDVLDPESIRYDLTFPEENFYYINTMGKLNLSDRVVEQMYDGDGIYIDRVGGKKVPVNIGFG